jgi:mediator of RNA polymerase II transcription subunit 10
VKCNPTTLHPPTTAQAKPTRRTNLIGNLVTLAKTAPNLPIIIPPDVIAYVQEGRNPDIYTREFVEITMKHNQKLKGKTEAFAQFRDVLAKELASAVPEMGDDVRRVVESGGGTFDG